MLKLSKLCRVPIFFRVPKLCNSPALVRSPRLNRVPELVRKPKPLTSLAMLNRVPRVSIDKTPLLRKKSK